MHASDVGWVNIPVDDDNLFVSDFQVLGSDSATTEKEREKFEELKEAVIR